MREHAARSSSPCPRRQARWTSGESAPAPTAPRSAFLHTSPSSSRSFRPEIDRALEEELRALYAGFEPFSFELRRARRFPGVLYLAPEPAEAHLELIRATAARYPAYPPYAGEIPLESIVPHLTVAHGDAALLEAAGADVRPRLPITGQAREVLLLEELEPEWGRWETRAAIPLGREAIR